MKQNPQMPVAADEEMVKILELVILKQTLYQSETYPFSPPMTAYMETFLPKDHEVTKRYFDQFKTKKSSKRKSSTVASPEKETRHSSRKKSKSQQGVVIREASPLQIH